MQVTHEIDTLTSVFRVSQNEMAVIDRDMPMFMARLIANKFVEENWPKIKKDKVLMKKVKDMVLEQSTERITKLIEEQVSNSLGIQAKMGEH